MSLVLCEALACWVILACFMHFVCVSLENVRVVDVVLDRICNGIMSALTVDLEVGFPVAFYSLVFGLYLDLLAQLVMIGPLLCCLRLLIGNLSSSVFPDRLCFLTMHLILVHLLVFLQLKLLQEHVLHDLVLFLPPLLILILGLEKRLPTIIPFINQVLKFPLPLLVVINKDAVALRSDGRGLKSVGVQVLKGKTGI